LVDPFVFDPFQSTLWRAPYRSVSTRGSHPTVCSISTSTDSGQTKDASTGEATRVFGFIGFHGIESNEKALQGLAGASLTIFSILLNVIPDYEQRPYQLGKKDKLPLCLMKLKLGISLFGVHGQTAQGIFVKILPVLVQRTKSWIYWSTKQVVNLTMFDSFKESSGDCRVILDCTEIKTERPPEVNQQAQMYSLYKSSFTVKVLIGMTPGGQISFLSKAYGGKSSDGYITRESEYWIFWSLVTWAWLTKGSQQSKYH